MKSAIVHIQYSVEVEPIEIEDYGRIYIEFESRHRNVLFLPALFLFFLIRYIPVELRYYVKPEYSK